MLPPPQKSWTYVDQDIFQLWWLKTKELAYAEVTDLQQRCAACALSKDILEMLDDAMGGGGIKELLKILRVVVVVVVVVVLNKIITRSFSRHPTTVNTS